MVTRLFMYVYGDIVTDARVNRAANALARDYQITVLSVDCGRQIQNNDVFNNVLIRNFHKGIRGYFEHIANAYRFIKKNKPDIFYAHDYYSALLVFLLLRSNVCKRIIYDAHELIIPEKGRRSFRQSFFYYFEQAIIKKVNLIICASEERAVIMQKHYKLIDKPLVVENVSQLEIIKDSVSLAILNSLDPFFKDHSPTIVYAGTVVQSRRIMDLLDAVGKISPKYKLLIIGNGDALDLLKIKAKEYPKLNVAFTGIVPYTSLGLLLSKCDLGFVYYPIDSLNNFYCASNKIYEYASVLLPMISNENVTVKRIIETYKIGIASDNFVDAIESIYCKLDEYKKNCILFNQLFPWNSVAERMLLTVKNKLK